MADAEPSSASARDLSGGGRRDPERLDRSLAAGELMDAEHLARYHWAAGLARGRRVLDAACGTAYGSAVLSRAGAESVVGADRAGDVLAEVRDEMPEGVELVSADLLELPFEDGSFDLVVCFEALEHLDDPEAGLDELGRVLAAGGILAVSSPNRDAYPPGNPHHVREYLPEELRDALARRFGHVRLHRQHAWTASALLGDEEMPRADGEPLPGAAVRKAAAVEPGEETFTVALASERELPAAEPLVVLGPGIDQRRAAEQEAEVRRMVDAQQEAAAAAAELDELRSRLIEAEQSLAWLPELYRQRAELAAVRNSLSWRATAPLRHLAESLRATTLPMARRRLKRLLGRLAASRVGRSAGGDD